MWGLLFLYAEGGGLLSAYDVSNGNHEAGGVTVYTLCPTQLVRCRLWNSIEADLDNCLMSRLGSTSPNILMGH